MLGDVDTEVFCTLLFDDEGEFEQGLEDMASYCDEIEDAMDSIFN